LPGDHPDLEEQLRSPSRLRFALRYVIAASRWEEALREVAGEGGLTVQDTTERAKWNQQVSGNEEGLADY
jgi:hypothetical protein